MRFTCRVVGIGATIWKGTAFNCPDSGNEITLLHSFYASGAALGSCGDGVIRINGSGFQNVTNEQYFSQVHLNASSNVNGASIECAYYDTENTSIVGTSVVKIVTGIYTYYII